MSNVIAFPKSPSILQQQALEHLSQLMRIQLACACANAHGQPTESDICNILDHITKVVELTSEYVGILRACEP